MSGSSALKTSRYRWLERTKCDLIVEQHHKNASMARISRLDLQAPATQANIVVRMITNILVAQFSWQAITSIAQLLNIVQAQTVSRAGLDNCGTATLRNRS